MAWIGLSFLAGMLALLGAVWIAAGAAPKAEMAEFRQINLKSGWGIVALLSLPGPVGHFVRAVQSEPDEVQRFDCVSTRLSEVDLETWNIEKRVAMWARVAFFSGVACSMACLCDELDNMQRLAPVRLLVPFTIGATAALLCRWLGRMAGEIAARRRSAWDTLSAVLVRPLLPERLERIRAGGLKSRCRDNA